MELSPGASYRISLLIRISFYLTLADTPSGQPLQVSVKRLKAVFVVRDFHGNPQFEERNFYLEGETPSGLKLEVTFADGEVMVGSTV